MTTRSAPGAGDMRPVACTRPRIGPVTAGAVITGTTVSLTTSSAVCLLHPAAAATTNITATIPNFQLPTSKELRVAPWELGIGGWELKRVQVMSLMGGEPLSRARDPRARSEKGKRHQWRGGGRRASPGAPGAAPQCRSVRAGKTPGRAARPVAPAG